ncbi:DUF3302 domain-containing protein [Thiohalocapsa sp.]|uniref:DUF3302 domain-containing protein n=1 Tax=Thiohalocapsa sp. TaxID=2497641 RepID=UPI00345C0834
MFLDYFALAMLFFVGITLFYGLIAIHDIPYEIARHRNHPQQDAIHVAGWISLFTLHAIWPFLWIWATLYREDRGWGFQRTVEQAEHDLSGIHKDLAALNRRLAHLEQSAPGAASVPAGAAGPKPKPTTAHDNPFSASGTAGAGAGAGAGPAAERTGNHN